jgi:AraC-like DNA-binding protein
MNCRMLTQSIRSLKARLPYRNPRDGQYKSGYLLVLLSTCLPSILIGAAIYYFGIAQIEREVERTHLSQVKQSARTMDGLFSRLESAAGEWALNPLFNESVHDFKLNYFFERTHELYTMLEFYSSSNPLIEQASLYLSEPAVVVSSVDGVQSAQDERFNELLTGSHAMFWTAAAPKLAHDSHTGRMALIHKLPVKNGKSAGALILYMNEPGVVQLLQDSGVEGEAAAFLLLGNREPIIISAASNIDIDSYGQSIGPILHEAASDSSYTYGSRIVEQLGVPFSFSYGKLQRAGESWTYITAAPLRQLVAPVAILSKLIIAISTAGLLTAVILSRLASRRMYRPVQSLLRRVNHLSEEAGQLEEKLNKQLPQLREGFLLQLAQGHLTSMSEALIRERMEQFGWDVHGKAFSVIRIRLLGLDHHDKFHTGDGQLVSFCAANIMEELAAGLPRMEACTINFQDLTAGLLLIHQQDQEEVTVRKQLSALADKIEASLRTVLGLNAVVVIGHSALSAKSIPSAFQEAGRALEYRGVQPDSQIIDLTALQIAPGTALTSYPFEIESELLQAIRGEDEQTAEQMLLAFVEALSANTGHVLTVRLGMLQLLGTIQHTYLKSGFYLQAGVSSTAEHPYEQLMELHELEAMISWMQVKVFHPYWEHLRSLKDASTMQLKSKVEDVAAALNASYMNDDISLETCAELHGIHPYTLSKAFKQHTGMNFIDYLTELRMNHSRKLLLETDMKINDVVARVGYQPSYFNRIFKKHERLTPSQYRQLLRNP